MDGLFASLTLKELQLMTKGVGFFICILTGFLFYRLCKLAVKMKKERFGENLYESLEDNFRTKSGLYEKLYRWLKAVGADYTIKEFSEPFQFVLVNAVVMISVFLVFGMLGDAVTGMIVAATLFITEILILVLLDKKQNKEMLDDISYLYDATEIQLSSHIYVVTAIANSLVYIKNKRLKKALEELCRNLALGGDVRGATRDFREKFSNAYLDAFCNVIVQIATETGEAGKLIEDMSKQLSVLKETSFREKKKEAETMLQLCIIAIFIVFTALIFYLSIVSMTSSAGILF